MDKNQEKERRNSGVRRFKADTRYEWVMESAVSLTLFRVHVGCGVAVNTTSVTWHDSIPTSFKPALSLGVVEALVTAQRQTRSTNTVPVIR